MGTPFDGLRVGWSENPDDHGREKPERRTGGGDPQTRPPVSSDEDVHVAAPSPSPKRKVTSPGFRRIGTFDGAMRRDAYRPARTAGSLSPDRLRSLSLDALTGAAAEREHGLALLHRRIAEALRAQAAPEAQAFADLAQEEEAGADPPSGTAEEDLPQDPTALFNLGVRRLEEAANFYLSVAEHAQDEDVVAEAQRRADAAIGRLRRLC